MTRHTFTYERLNTLLLPLIIVTLTLATLLHALA